MVGRSALVTGATGFIGSRLVAALTAGGWQVRACGRRVRPAWLPAEVDYRSVDLVQDDLAGLGEGVTHVFHLAGASSSLSSVEEMQRANVVATERLLTSLTGLGGGSLERLLYMSSTSVYGEEEQLPLPVSEDAAPRPSREYGKAKWGAEQLVWSAGLGGMDVVVARPVSVYGPGNIKLLGSAVLDVAIERFARHDRLPIPAEPIEQRLVHIDDVIRATQHLATYPEARGRAFNLVFPEYPTSHQVAGVLAAEFDMSTEDTDDAAAGLSYEERQAIRRTMLDQGMRPDLLLTRERFRFFGKANRNNRLSVDALLGTGFGFEDDHLAAGIRRTISWYRDNRWIL